jgi:hypothetical protein
MSQATPSRHLLLALCLAFLPTSYGCGGGTQDVSTPSEVTDEMKRQAEASSKYMEEQSRPKKAATK